VDWTHQYYALSDKKKRIKFYYSVKFREEASYLFGREGSNSSTT
jgi:hypothetical protein